MKTIYRFISGVNASCLIFLALGLAHNSYAFESPEHKELGDTALMVVAEQYRCYSKDPANRVICNGLKSINEATPSYGDIVACVDYYLTPEKLISQYDSSNMHMMEDWPGTQCNGSQTKFIQASHSNHTHFQKELLVSLDTYHLLAVSIGRDKKNIAGALFVNAIADHYLQDFFAPGHITVRRDRITDLLSNASHDAANREGATFHASTGVNFQRLKNTIENIRSLAASNSAAGQDEASKDNFKKICGFLLGDEQHDKPACVLPDSVSGFDQVNLKGDGFLGRSDGYEQRIVMLAADVISITDVLKAVEDGQPHNFYDDYLFLYRDNSNAKKRSVKSYMPNITAKLPFGYYALGSNPKASDWNDRLLPFSSDMVWSASIAEEQFSSGTGVARTATALELIPYGVVSNGLFENIFVAMGLYHYEGSGDVTGNGVTGRLGFIIPETESTFSLGLRHVRHTDSGFNEWGDGWNIRYDQGYSSFFSLFISAGRDYSAGTGAQLAFGNYLSAGIMIAAPTGRISNCVKDLSHCM